MTDEVLLLRLVVLAAVAAAVGVPAQARAVAHGPATPQPADRAAGATLFVALLGVVAAIVGTILAPRVGLTAPLLGARLGNLDVPRVMRLTGAGVLGGGLAALGLLVYYWGAARFDRELFQVGDAIRRAMGLPARVALGGVLEEIVYRWGVLALVAWMATPVVGRGPTMEWMAIIGAALAFAAGHVPGAAALSRTGLSAGGLAVGLTVNGWLGLVAGWLVWHRGLASAMIAHGTVHVLWAVLERGRIDKTPAPTA